MTNATKKINTAKSIKVPSERNKKKVKTITEEILQHYAKTFEDLTRYDRGERPVPRSS